MYNDDEKTEFEANPMGARQRLIPSHVFRAKQPIVAAPAEPLPEYAPAVVPEHTPPGGFPALEPLGMIASLASPARAIAWEAPSYVAAVPSVAPRRPPTQAAAAQTRRSVSTWIASSLGALAGLAIALGLSARSVEATAMDAGLATVEAEPIRAGWLETARESAPPPEIDLDAIELAPVIVKRAARPAARPQVSRASAKRRPVKVNASSALGDLRVVRSR